MTLVERFIEIDGWSVSRKTVLFMALALGMHCLDWQVMRLAVAGPRVIDAIVIDRLMSVGILPYALSLVVAAIPAWLGREGRWTSYFTAALLCGFISLVPYVLGEWGTPTLLLLPLLALTGALIYGKELGLFMLALGMCLAAIIGGLQAFEMLPYAPAMLNRTLEAQQTSAWIVVGLSPVIAVFVFSFAMSILLLEARKLQDIRLREANQKIAETGERLKRSNQLIARYVPTQIAQQIMSGVEEAPTPYERRKLTIFFSDLVGFTDISEELEPEDLSHLLNEYFSEMTAIAHRHGGTVDELSGDAILVFFGAPQATNDKEHAIRAVQMGLEMQQAMAGLNARWRTAGITESLRVRMGINTGVVTIGNFGSPERMKYAALGKHVNLAARIQSNCEPGKVLLSHATWLLVNDQIPCTEKGEFQLKGIIKPVMAYEPTGSASS